MVQNYGTFLTTCVKIKIEYKKYWLYINSKYHRSLKNKIKYSRLFQMLLKALNYGKRLFK